MLYNRTASITIGLEGGTGREIKSLRMAFSIEKGATKSPNTCTAKIWNLSTETRSLVEVIGNVLILKAGYVEDVGAVTIFTGNVSRSLTIREGPDWITELELEDGLFEFRDTKVSISFSPGATVLQVLNDVSSRFTLPVRAFPAGINNRQYVNGFAFVGRVRDSMDKVCEFADLEWSIQNRAVQVIKKGGIYQQQALVLSSDTGMIESPQHESKTMTEKAAAKEGITANQPGVRITTRRDKEGTQQEVLQVLGYTVKSLLQPKLEPGGYVQLKTVGVKDEFFRIEKLTHTGDTHGMDWFTELTLRYPKNV